MIELSKKTKLALIAGSLLTAAFGAQAQSINVGNFVPPAFNNVVNQVAPAAQKMYNQSQQQQAPQAQKVKQAQKGQQSDFEQSASALGGSLKETGSGLLGVVGNTAKVAVTGVGAVASGIGGFFKTAISGTPEFNQENFETKVLGSLNVNSKTDVKNTNVVVGKKQTGNIHTYVIYQDDVVYGLTVSNVGNNSIETLNNPRFKSDENPKGYSKITLDPTVARSFETTFQQNMHREAAPTTPSTNGWGGPSYGG